MKFLAKICFLSTVLCGSMFIWNACGQAQEESAKPKSGNFVLNGVWVVTDEKGNKFTITLNEDGTATSTWKVLDQGHWRVVDQKKAHIQWKNGINEFIIVDARGKAVKQTYAPGKSLEGKPDQTIPIEKQ